MPRTPIRARTAAALCAFAFLAAAPRAWAEDPAPPEPTAPGSEPAPPGSEPSPPGNEPAAPGAAAPAAPGEAGKLGSISWRDIVVVPRRPILKYHRVELVPTYNVSFNSSVIKHHGFGGIINFFLSETLNIALEGTYYQQELLTHYFLRGLDDRVLPSVNRYRWSATVNFGYVPVYGKLALFNKWILQWETFIQAGIGVLQTEWIPRDPANQGLTNYNVLWHIDLGMRAFLTKWLALQVYLKDYMFVDNYEPANRTTVMVQPNSGVSQFVNNLVFGVGVGMFLPTGFEYKYTR